jgi:2-oxoglutarate ferredoxin oxidoreductase subunit delta
MPKKGYVEIDIEACKGCNLCVINCPTECLALNTSDTNSYSLYYSYVVDQDKCIACMNCAVICPDAAITVYREVKQPAKEENKEKKKVEVEVVGSIRGAGEAGGEAAAAKHAEGGKVG